LSAQAEFEQELAGGDLLSGDSMNLQTLDHSMTMDSRDIAEITDKDHYNVLADIRLMLSRIVNSEDKSYDISSPEISGKLETLDLPFRSEYKDANGRSRPCFKLPYRETMILVSGYSVELRAKVVDRWMELERQRNAVQQPIPSTLELLDGWRNSELQRLEAERQLTLSQEKVQALDDEITTYYAPKAEAHTRIAESSAGAIALRYAAKELQVSPLKLNRWLLTNKWIYRSEVSDNYIAYQDKIRQGYLEHKRGENFGHSFQQVLVTVRGIAKLSEIVPVEKNESDVTQFFDKEGNCLMEDNNFGPVSRRNH
jgi:phage antirepressor YoqD-like protein/phage regulator Rha-like protein